MRILQLTAENVKKLSVVNIKPNGGLVQITGKNGQGKTSVLDSIYWALGGAKDVQAKPIRNGETTARIELQLGDGKSVTMIVERRFTEKSSYLSVRTADGAEYRSPQKLLDDILGSLTFDPLGFLRQDQRKQFETLRQMVTLDVDLDALDAERAVLFELRTTTNKNAKDAEARASAIAVPHDIPDREIDTAPILDRMTRASDHNENARRIVAERESALAAVTSARDNVLSLEEKLEAARAALETAEAAYVTADKAEVPALIDASEARANLDEANRINGEVRKRKERDGHRARAAQALAESAMLTAQIDAIDTKKRDAIAAADMPVDGLGFGDGVVTFNGLPLDQASDAEQLKVSTAIAAALNPKLRVIRIRDGSLLDDDAMVWLAKFAEARDFQIWVERVDGSGSVGIVMEDGHVRGQQLQAAE